MHRTSGGHRYAVDQGPYAVIAETVDHGQTRNAAALGRVDAAQQ